MRDSHWYVGSERNYIALGLAVRKLPDLAGIFTFGTVFAASKLEESESARRIIHPSSSVDFWSVVTAQYLGMVDKRKHA